MNHWAIPEAKKTIIIINQLYPKNVTKNNTEYSAFITFFKWLRWMVSNALY